MSVLNGSDVLIFINDGIDDYAIACQRGVSVSITDAIIDTTCKQDEGYFNGMSGKREFEFTCDALVDFGSVDYGINDLFDAVENRTQLPFTISNAAFTSLYYTGTCECTSIAANAGLEDVATYTATFKGTAELEGLTS